MSPGSEPCPTHRPELLSVVFTKAEASALLDAVGVAMGESLVTPAMETATHALEDVLGRARTGFTRYDRR